MLSLTSGILIVALEPLLIKPSGLANTALNVAEPVSVEISPLAISTLPFKGYFAEFARIRVAGGIFFIFSSIVTPGESERRSRSCFSFHVKYANTSLISERVVKDSELLLPTRAPVLYGIIPIIPSCGLLSVV